MARHSLGAIAALSSDIDVCVFVTVISVAPIAMFTCSGLSRNPSITPSATGAAYFDVAVGGVVDDLVPWLLPLLHPAVSMQTPPTVSAAVSRRMCPLPIPGPFPPKPGTGQHG